MTRWFFLLLISTLPCLCISQIGVYSRYLFGKSEILDAEFIGQNGQHTSLEYNFRLAQKRLEFRPGIGYRTTFQGSEGDGHIKGYDFDIGTAVYPFDFGGDCDCPTFSKDGNLVKKGFFFEVTPGVSYQVLSRLRSEPDDPSRLPIRSKNLVWKIGGAAGLDIGLSEKFTLTPILSATMLSSSDWEGLRKDGSAGTLDDYIYYGAGFRLTYNEDDKKRRRRN